MLSWNKRAFKCKYDNYDYNYLKIQFVEKPSSINNFNNQQFNHNVLNLIRREDIEKVLNENRKQDEEKRKLPNIEEIDLDRISVNQRIKDKIKENHRTKTRIKKFSTTQEDLAKRMGYKDDYFRKIVNDDKYKFDREHLISIAVHLGMTTNQINKMLIKANQAELHDSVGNDEYLGESVIKVAMENGDCDYKRLQGLINEFSEKYNKTNDETYKIIIDSDY